MLFLIGRKVHPLIAVTLGVLVLVLGVVLHSYLLAAGGAVYVVFSGLRAVRRMRGGTRNGGLAR
jgi:hypothetical protein